MAPSSRGDSRCPVFEDYTLFPNSHVLRSSDSRYVRYPLERLARVCPFFDGLLSLPQPQCPVSQASSRTGPCPFGAGSKVTPLAPASPAEVDESNVIDLPVTWGGLRLCLELVDADLTCPALGGTRPSSPSSLLRDGVEEHINAMVETAHAFGLTFIGNHVYNAFAGRELSPEASSADPLWVFAVVASIGSTDVLAPAAWNTLRPDYDIFRASLQGKRLLLKFACDELRELYMLHHAWNYALQVYEARMIELAETDAREWRGATVMWECIYPHTNCPYPNVAPVVAAATKLVKDHLYAHPVATEQTLAEIVDRVCDPVRLTDVIAPAMGQCDTCKFVDGGVLDVLVQVVDDSFVKVLKAEVQGLRRLGR